MRKAIAIPWATLLVFCVSMAVLIWRLNNPGVMVFDETHYVRAGRELLALSKHTNPEHPPFAKLMIAAGIGMIGDNPWGWRLLGALIGAAGVGATYYSVSRMSQSGWTGILAATFLLLSISYTIQSRIAMLDTYAYPLFACSIACVIGAAQSFNRSGLRTGLLLLGGVLLGLATSAKWIAGFYAVLGVVGILAVRTHYLARAGQNPLTFLFNSSGPTLYGERLIAPLLIFGLVSLLTYFATFIPLMFLSQGALSPIGIFTEQLSMVTRQTAQLAENSYESEWWEWPLMLEPIWYYFSTGPTEGHQAVLYIGNPVIYWGGLVCVPLAIWQAARGQGVLGLRVAVAWLASWLFYAVLPKQIGFLFYYSGSAMLLSVLMAVTIHQMANSIAKRLIGGILIAGCIGMFVYFAPVIYAIEMPLGVWTKYLWFPRWA